MSSDEVEKALKFYKGWVTTANIAKKMKMSKNSVLRGLRGLEIRDLVEKKQNPNGMGFVWKLK